MKKRLLPLLLITVMNLSCFNDLENLYNDVVNFRNQVSQVSIFLPRWAKTVETGPNISGFNSVAVASDGSVYAAGYIYGNSEYNFGNNVKATGKFPTNKNIILVKYDSSGTAQWAKTVESDSANNSSGFLGVAIASDGSVFAVGYISGTSQFKFGNSVTATGTCSMSNVLLIKYNSSGTPQWAKTIESGGADGSQFFSVSIGSDNSIYVSGHILYDQEFNFGNNVKVSGKCASHAYLPVSNAVVVKYNSSGDAQWAHSTYAASNISEFYSLALSSGDDVYAAGFIYNVGEFNFGESGNDLKVSGQTNSYNIVLVKFSSSGVGQWAKSVVTGSANQASGYNGVSVDSNGNIYAAGYINNNSEFAFGNSVTATGKSTSGNIILVKYNSSGNAQWAKTVSADSTNNGTSYKSVNISSDGSIYAAGYIKSNSEINFGNSVKASGKSSGLNIILVKYDNSGVPQKAFSLETGPGESEYSSVFASSGGVYAAGYIKGNSEYNFGNNVKATGTNTSFTMENIVLVKYK